MYKYIAQLTSVRQKQGTSPVRAMHTRAIIKMISVATFICLSLLTVGHCKPLEVENLEEFVTCENDRLSMNFSGTVISSIGENFIASPLVTCLNLESCEIHHLDRHAFDRLPNLKYLNLNGNMIEWSILLHGHSNIEILILSNQHYGDSPYYTTKSMDILGSYPQLWYMDCSFNHMEQINFVPEWDLDTLPIYAIPFPKLKYLDLSHNRLQEDTFKDILPVSLTHLYLQDNAINRISLSHLTNLSVLTLDDNPTLHELTVSGLINLKYLSIARTMLRIRPSFFDGLVALEYLDLTNNQLKVIEEGTLEAMPSLKTLILDNNNLHSLPGTFEPLSIETLSLSCNGLERLSFENLPRLKNLTLNGNNIPSLASLTFSGQQMLEELRLSSNQIESLPEGWCDGCKSLWYLDLSDNRLAVLDYSGLIVSEASPLQMINLRGNPLKNINVRSIGYLSVNVTINLDLKYGGALPTCAGQTGDTDYWDENMR